MEIGESEQDEQMNRLGQWRTDRTPCPALPGVAVRVWGGCLLVKIWASCLQILRLFSDEFKVRNPTDLQDKQDNFI